MTQEFKVIIDSYKKDIHKKRSLSSTFEEKVNDALRAGYKIINAQYSVSGMLRSYIGFLVRES